MSVVSAFLMLPEDLSLYTRFTAIGTVTGNGTLQTVANITGKGYLLDAIAALNSAGLSNIPLEFKLTIDGVVYFWSGGNVSGNAPAIGLIDLDALSGGNRRQVGNSGNGSSPNGVSAVAGIAFSSSMQTRTTPSQSKVNGSLVIRQPISFNSSCKVEIQTTSQGMAYEIHACYK